MTEEMSKWVCPNCQKAKTLCICEKSISQEDIEKAKKRLTAQIKDEINNINDKEALIALCKELLKGIDLLSRKEYVVQPFLSIILRHIDTISKHKLMEFDK